MIGYNQGMEFSKPQKYRVRLSDKYLLGDSQRFLYVKFELIEPSRLSFYAGQYVSLLVGTDGVRRSYSIVSTPDIEHGFALLVELIPGGRGSEFLKQLEIGKEAEILAPLGRFVVNDLTRESNKAIVGENKLFVATGSGIVPIWSMIHDLLINQKYSAPIRLHWGMRSEADLFWLDHLERLSEVYPYFVYDVVLSKPSENWELCSGHVQDCLVRDFAGEKKLVGWEAYVCGSPKMVLETVDLLATLGMDENKIKHEKFS